MPRNIPPSPFNVTALIPELAGLGRETMLLYPRSGAPEVHDSSIGGPLLWPAAEPWPLCADPVHYNPAHESTSAVGPEPVAMVPVVQLYARDVPELSFPAGRDVLQVVWCPLIHKSQDQCTVLPQLYWRSEAEVSATGVRAEVLPDPLAPHGHDEDFVPRPCTVSPTRVEEYPNWDMPEGLAPTLADRFDEIEAEFGCSYYDVATTIQSKVGGYPGWTQPPNWPDCACGRRMEHLLSITATEPGGGRWLPMDEHRDGTQVPLWQAEVDPAVDDAIGHGMDMGDLGGMYFFFCPTCPGTPWTYRYDC
ncbi:hypothetical protein [Streptomyces sp. NBC_00827]|uniref:hypothetical protein n=1 Tax=Streptomyces sp. NBC_00827 TaxID=2903677 RepID=UPI00386B85B9|nr:hypothetical protein OG569_13415 [Streptomyces sp. NBC_00827]